MTDLLPDAPFAPLPLRRRTTLEILDTAVKLYRRYLGVLLGWSAVVALVYVLFSFLCSFVSFLALPLLYGSVSCCIAAAVRGQRVGFKQVWEFTQPRFGAVLGVTLLSSLIFGVAVGVLMLVGVLIGVGGAYAFANAPEILQIIGVIIGFVLGLIAYSIASLMAFGWLNMVPIVACLEDDKRGIAAMGRAWSLMSGNWRKIFSIATLLGLSAIVVVAIVVGLLAVFGVGTNIFTSSISETAMWGMIAGMTGLFALFFLFWNPAQAMVIAVLYLDLRVRKEALDLEWNAYASAPAPVATEAPPAISVIQSAPELGAVSAFNSPNLAPDVLSTNAPIDLNKPNLAAPTEVASPVPAPTFGAPSAFVDNGFSASGHSSSAPIQTPNSVPDTPAIASNPGFNAPVAPGFASEPPVFSAGTSTRESPALVQETPTSDNDFGRDLSPFVDETALTSSRETSAFVDETPPMTTTVAPRETSAFVDETPIATQTPNAPSFAPETSGFAAPTLDDSVFNTSASSFGAPPVVDETPTSGVFGQALQALDEVAPTPAPPAKTPSSDEHSRF